MEPLKKILFILLIVNMANVKGQEKDVFFHNTYFDFKVIDSDSTIKNYFDIRDTIDAPILYDCDKKDSVVSRIIMHAGDISFHVSFQKKGMIETISLSQNDSISINYRHFENGNVKSILKKVSFNKYIGTQQFFHDNGQFRYQLHADSSIQLYRECHSNGITAVKTKMYLFQNFLFPIGDFEMFYKNGNKRVVGQYNMEPIFIVDKNLEGHEFFRAKESYSVKIGIWKYYDEEGRLCLKEWYSAEGDLIKQKEKREGFKVDFGFIHLAGVKKQHFP